MGFLDVKLICIEVVFLWHLPLKHVTIQIHKTGVVEMENKEIMEMLVQMNKTILEMETRPTRNAFGNA